MKRLLIFAMVGIGFQAPLHAHAQAGTDRSQILNNDKYYEGKKHILFLGANHYYAHEAVSKAMYTMAKLGEESGLFDVTIRTDDRLVTKQRPSDYIILGKNLDFFDAVMIFTQGEFRWTDEQKADFMSFVREDGKGVLIAHSGTDFNRWEFRPFGGLVSKDKYGGWPEYFDMVGGVFFNHPWVQKVRIKVEDKQFPAMRHFPDTIEVEDEIYQLPDLSREDVRVLMSLDVSSVDLENPPSGPVVRKDLDFPLAWVREWGEGRVFVSPLGHLLVHWDRDDMQKMWFEAARWVLKLSEGDATPRPKPTTTNGDVPNK